MSSSWAVYNAIMSLVIALSGVFRAHALTPIESLQKTLDESPKICSALEAEMGAWRGVKRERDAYSIPKRDLPRALELLAVCKALPQEPSNETIALIGKAIMAHKPTAEPIVENLVKTECITQCTDISIALANSDQSKGAKTRILDYLTKPKYPTLDVPGKHHELILHGAKKGLWKLTKEDENRLEVLKKELEKAKLEFDPSTQAPLKDSRGKVVPTNHPKYLEELQSAIQFQEKQMEISKRLK